MYRRKSSIWASTAEPIAGIHFCLGAPLARLEAQIAIGQLIDRFPRLSLAAEPGQLRWKDNVFLRGLEQLPVHLAQ